MWCRGQVSEALRQNRNTRPFASEASRKFSATMPFRLPKNSFQNILQSPSCNRLKSCTILLCLKNCFEKRKPCEHPKPQGPWPIFHRHHLLITVVASFIFGVFKNKSRRNILDHGPMRSPLCSFGIGPKQ